MSSPDSLSGTQGRAGSQTEVSGRALLMSLVYGTRCVPFVTASPPSTKHPKTTTPYRTSADGLEILTMPNGLYQLARRLCVVLNHPKLNDVLLSHAVRTQRLKIFQFCISCLSVLILSIASLITLFLPAPGVCNSIRD
jgi:hypothetical protein